MNENEKMRLLITRQKLYLKKKISEKINIINLIKKSNDSELIELQKELDQLIRYYFIKHNEVKKYLPDIKNLVVNDTIFIVVDVHGEIIFPYSFIDIPKSMTLFKLMETDYGALSCLPPAYVYRIREIMQHYIYHRSDKNTRRNNTKFIKKILSTIIPIFKSSINSKTSNLIKVKTNKTLKKTLGFNNWSNQTMNRFLKSKMHVHKYSNSDKSLSSSKRIIKKIYSINLNVYDKMDGIYAMNKNHRYVNLIDYVDIKLEKDYYLSVRMEDIFNLFKDVKFVLYIDTSCSSREGSNNVLNHLKQTAKEVEGNSITQEIINYNNSSPYNSSFEYEQEQQKIKENMNRFYDEGWNTLKKNRAETRRKLPLWRRFSLF
jgi:hypothetical protein